VGDSRGIIHLPKGQEDDFMPKETFTEIAFSAARIGAAAYLGLCLFVLFRQSRYVYYPDRTVGLTPQYLGMTYEPVEFSTKDGVRLSAWFVHAPEPAGQGTDDVRTSTRTVLFCHGNAGDIGDRLDSIKTFHNLGLNTFIFDYRGYGDSSGRPTEKGTYLDAMAAWNHLTHARKIPAGDIVLFGRSLGGAVAAWLAERVAAGALVVESTFTSAPDMAREMFPFLPVRLFCRFKYDAASTIGSARCPVLVAHSKDDTMIPFKHGHKLFDLAPEPKRFVQMSGDHNAGGLDANPDYQNILREFLDTHM